MDGKTYEALGLSRSLDEVSPGVVINGRANREIRGSATAPGDRQYNPCPEAFLAAETPRGEVRSFRDWVVLSEVLPFVEAEIGCKLTEDAARRTICGISSGGICAFNAAWWRPDAFGRVISHCGSFTNIRGGHNFPSMVRMTERKPIRVWMQSGAADADILYGNWPLANREMAAALEFAGYDVKFVFGEGGHSLRHGGAVFADTLRWLWREA